MKQRYIYICQIALINAFMLLIISGINNIQAQDILTFGEENRKSTNISQPLKNLRPQQEVTVFKSQEINTKYTFYGAKHFVSQIENRKFDVVSIPGFSAMSEPGKPALPVHVDNVLLPGNAKVQVEIISADTIELNDYYIKPAMTPAIDTEGADEPEFVIDNQLYSTDEFYPKSPVYVNSETMLRGNKIVSIAVAPIQFNPVTSTLNVFKNVKYKVTYQSGKTFEELKYENNEHYLDMYRNISINKQQIPKKSEINTKNNQSTDYIIITDANYKSAADTLAKWKRMLGYSVDIISDNSWTSSMVKDSIHNIYNGNTVKPDYFVILGDHEDVPAEIHQAPDGDNFGTDLYYACMDGSGDYVPDMAHGRLAVSNSTEAMNVVQKIVNYERNPVTDTGFYNKASNCSYYQGYESNGDTYTSRRFIHTSEEIYSYLDTKGYSIDRIYETDQGISPQYYQNGYYSDGQQIPSDLLMSNGFQWDGNSSDISSAINNGRFYVFHRDHGYTGSYGWAHPQFLRYHVGNLSNGNKTPVVFSINCHTGNFLESKSFAETFLRHSNGGAVGVVAPSYYSYSGPNDGLATGLIDAIWSNPGLLSDFGSGGISNPSLSAHNDIYTMGDVVNQGLIRMTETWPGYGEQSQYTHELYHYFGDPAMRIFTQKPNHIAAKVQDSINGFAIQIDSANAANAIATLTIDGQLLAKINLKNGCGTLNFTDSIEGEAVITISDHNYVPYVENVYIDNVIKPNPPAIQAKNISFASSSKSKSVSLNITWEPGDGDHRVVKINDKEEFTDPVDGEEYEADNYYHHDGEQVVYVGEGSEVTVYNLDTNTIYWVRIYEYNNEGSYTKYTTTEETGNPKNQTDSEEGALPVQLISFEGQQNASNIKLTWQTASEVNNDYFKLQKIEQNKLFPIACVTGSGMSNEIADYQYTDEKPVEGENYYRLTQVDYDGSKEVLKTIAVNYNTDKNLVIDKIRETDNEIVISTKGKTDEGMQVTLTGIDGRLVEERLLTAEELNTGSFLVNISGCRQGYYILRLVNQERSMSRKIAIFH